MASILSSPIYRPILGQQRIDFDALSPPNIGGGSLPSGGHYIYKLYSSRHNSPSTSVLWSIRVQVSYSIRVLSMQRCGTAPWFDTAVAHGVSLDIRRGAADEAHKCSTFTLDFEKIEALRATDAWTGGGVRRRESLSCVVTRIMLKIWMRKSCNTHLQWEWCLAEWLRNMTASTTVI